MGDLSRSHNSKHHHWSKMGPKLRTALLLFLPLLSLSLANSNTAAEDDSKQDLVNPSANQVGASQAGHVLVKREAGRGRKSCEGKRCNKKKTLQKKGKKDAQKPKNNEKKRKSLR